MKKFLLLIAILAGFVGGIITTIYFSALYNLNNSNSPIALESESNPSKASKQTNPKEELSGLTLFAEKGECMDIKGKIIEVKKSLNPIWHWRKPEIY